MRENAKTGKVYLEIFFQEDAFPVPDAKYLWGLERARKRSVMRPRKMQVEHMNQIEWNWGK